MSDDRDPRTVAGRFPLQGRIRSFGHAFRGLRILVRTQRNAWIHSLATVGVCITGLLLGFTRGEWCWILLAIISVWTAEALNTAFELLADAASPEYHPLIGKAKDVAAGAVLITAVGAVLIGGIVVWPHLHR